MEPAGLIVGQDAGKVWHALEETQELTLKQLVEMLAIDELSVAAAIGWLAREGKIFYRKCGSELCFSNKPDVGSYDFG